MMNPRLLKFPLRIHLPVQWGDMDASGSVSATALYRHFESARLAYFRDLISPRLSPATRDAFIHGKGVGRILHSATIRIVDDNDADGREGDNGGADEDALLRRARQLRYPDTLVLAARTPPDRIATHAFEQEYLCVSTRLSAAAAAGLVVVATGTARIVAFDHVAKRKAALPLEVVDAMRAVEEEAVAAAEEFRNLNR